MFLDIDTLVNSPVQSRLFGEGRIEENHHPPFQPLRLSCSRRVYLPFSKDNSLDHGGSTDGTGSEIILSGRLIKNLYQEGISKSQIGLISYRQDMGILVGVEWWTAEEWQGGETTVPLLVR